MIEARALEGKKIRTEKDVEKGIPGKGSDVNKGQRSDWVYCILGQWRAPSSKIGGACWEEE